MMVVAAMMTVIVSITAMITVIVSIMAVMTIIVIIETSVIEEVVDDGGPGPRVDVRREKMIQFSPVQIIGRHASPFTCRAPILCRINRAELRK
jgi:hypothetical protein